MIELPKDFLVGSYPPVITPFREGRVDFDRFAALVDRQVRLGSDGVVVTGTTGEPSSLTIAERVELTRTAIGAVAGRCPVVAATGSQSYAETLELTTEAEKAGASAVLIVTPYYIRPSQQGLVEYFVALGDRIALPLLLYHIPGRAAVSVTVDTVARIGDRLPSLVGMKHATNDLEFVTDVLKRCGQKFRVFCGLEALSLPMLAVGAAGVMNAAANLVPREIADLCRAVRRGDLVEARRLHDALFELNQAIFFDTNPIPLKYMMMRVGLLDTPEVRLPLVPPTDEKRVRLDEVLRASGLLAETAARH